MRSRAGSWRSLLALLSAATMARSVSPLPLLQQLDIALALEPRLGVGSQAAPLVPRYGIMPPRQSLTACADEPRWKLTFVVKKGKAEMASYRQSPSRISHRNPPGSHGAIA